MSRLMLQLDGREEAIYNLPDLSLSDDEIIDLELLITLLGYRVEEFVRDYREQELRQSALKSDQQLLVYLRWIGVKEPVVRAEVYGKRIISRLQEIAGFGVDRRRPVLMRGSLRFLTSQNDYIDQIIHRYWRRTRTIFITKRDFTNAYTQLFDLIESRLRTIHKRQRFSFVYEKEWKPYTVYTGGEIRQLSKEQYLEKEDEVLEREERENLPRKLSSAVAYRSLRELGVHVPKKHAKRVLEELVTERRTL